MMTKSLVIAAAALGLATPAAAQHLDNLDTPYASRGACESNVARFNTDVRPVLTENFPQFFGDNGDAAAFLTRAFPCEMGDDGNWYIQDRRGAVLFSDWYQRRP